MKKAFTGGAQQAQTAPFPAPGTLLTGRRNVRSAVRALAPAGHPAAAPLCSGCIGNAASLQQLDSGARCRLVPTPGKTSLLASSPGFLLTNP